MAGLTRAYQRSRALTVVAELGIADLLGDDERSVGFLAESTATHAPTLYRVLRALASIGVLHEGPGQSFSLTTKGEYLRSDHPLSLAPAAAMLGADYEWKAWGELMHSVRTGENAAVHALGTDVWEYRRRNPSAEEMFDAAMRTFTRSSASAEVAAYDFARHAVVADIGGGIGAMIAAILTADDTMRGILFDQAEVVKGARDVLESAGVADRVEVVGGDFFDAVPEGADAYVLRRILHDWEDDACLRILANIRRVMAGDERLIIIDGVVGPPNEDPLVKFLDLMMLVSAGGRERTDSEWTDLLGRAGFRLDAIIPATANSSVLVAAVGS